MIKRLLLFFSVLCFTAATSQNVHDLLVKAFTSKDSSEFYFKKAKRNLKTEADVGEYYFCKNAWHADFGSRDSAVYYGKKAIPKFKKLKDYDKLFYVYNNCAKIFLPTGNYEKAIAWNLEGLRVAEQIKNKYWTANFARSIAVAYHDFEDYSRGVMYGKKALATIMSDKKYDPLAAVGANNAIAINFDDWNKPDSALAYHYKSISLVKGKDTVLLGMVYNNIGNTLLKQKKYLQAKKWVEKALAVAPYGNEKESQFYYYEIATNYTNLATIAFHLNNDDQAEKYFKLAFDSALKSKSIEKLRDYYHQQYLFNKQRKNLEKAFAFQDEYLKLRDSVFDVERAKTFADLEAKYQTEKKEKEILRSKAEIVRRNDEIKKKNIQFIGLALISVALAVIGWLLFRQQKMRNRQQAQEHDLKTAISQIETQNKLQEQRLQISRDLHDNIGSQLTFIISSVDNLKYAFDIGNTKLGSKLFGISNFAQETIVELRDTIWAMNNNEISFDDLQARLLNFIEKAREAKGDIRFSFTVDPELGNVKLTSIVGMNIHRTIQEAINNALKYSGASEIGIYISKQGEDVRIVIDDNGSGFDQKNVQRGNGLSNMEKRIGDIGGNISIDSGNGRGTRITLDLHRLVKS